MCLTTDEYWRRYCWRNAATREAYLNDRYSVDTRFNVIFLHEREEYEREVLNGNPIDEYEHYKPKRTPWRRLDKELSDLQRTTGRVSDVFPK